MTTAISRAQYEAAAGVQAKLDAVADEGGIIQAADARRIMPHAQPTWHETQTYATAAERLGLRQDADGEWYAVATQ